jgi:hypothetical protein
MPHRRDPLALAAPPPSHSGFDLAQVTQSPHRLHIEIAASQMGPTNLTIGGLAFRTWRPFSVTGDLNVLRVEMESVSPGGPVTSTSLARAPGTASTLVADSTVSPLVMPDVGPVMWENRYDRFADSASRGSAAASPCRVTLGGAR